MKSNFFFREIAFLAIIDFFWTFLKWQKMEFGQINFRAIDLFDFMSFFGQDFLNFSGPLCPNTLYIRT